MMLVCTLHYRHSKLYSVFSVVLLVKQTILLGEGTEAARRTFLIEL